MEGAGKPVRVSPPDHLLAAHLSVLLIVHVVLPNLKVSLHVSGTVLLLGRPHHLDGLVLGTIEAFSVLLSPPPLVEHPAKEMLPHEYVTEVSLLDFHLYRFEGALMPLLDGDLEAVLSQALNCFYERFQRSVALSVEFAVREEFIDSLLLAFLEHMLKEDECQLSHKKLVVVTIMALHLGTLA